MTGERKIVGIRPPSDTVTANLSQTVAPDGDLADGDLPLVSAVPSSTDIPIAPDIVWDDDADGDDRADAFGPLFVWAVHLGTLIWIGLAVFEGTDGFRVLPAIDGLAGLARAVIPAIMLWVLAIAIMRRLSTKAHTRQIAVLQAMRNEYIALDDRLQAMHAHWRDADRELQGRATTLASVGLDTVARLHDAGAGIEQSLSRCSSAAASLAERGEYGQRQLDSLAIAVPRIEEITLRLSENLRQAGQSAYQFGGQLEAQIANIGIEAATAGAALSEASDSLAERVTMLSTTSQETQTALASGAAMLGTAAEQQRDQALTLLAEFAASANEATTQAEARITAARAQARLHLEQDTAALHLQLAQVHEATAALRAAIDEATASSADLRTELAEQIHAARDQLAAVEAEGRARLHALSDALQLLSDGMGTFRERAAAGDEQAVALIQRAETLLIALDSAVREIDETVPAALSRLTGHADSAETTVARLSPLAEAEIARVSEIDTRLQAITAALSGQRESITALGDASGNLLAQRQAQLADVEAALYAVEQRIVDVANGPMAAFSHRLADVETETGEALARTEEAVQRLVHAASERAATDLGAAIDRVAGAGINDRLAAMSGHADQAVAAAAAASDRLMRQLITIADSSAALEHRAQEVSALSGDVERETLARQMALLSEALQSTAVDLTRILDTDVADQAWDAYLKGDRSIFARRAAKLLSNAEARDLLRRYESHDGFKAQVNRYIHDFEAMLRGVMDTRDGHALSVTLLSSDIGKLYVALAQAIERLRQ